MSEETGDPREITAAPAPDPGADPLEKFKRFLDIVTGKEDIREKLAFLFQPVDIRTASNLSVPQAEFIADSYFVAPYFPELAPMLDLAKQVATTATSVKGGRVTDAINYARASKGSGAPTVGIYQGIKEKFTGKKGDKANE